MPLYEKLAGDTEVFALRIGFDKDPDQGAGAAPEDAASWGHFQIWVEGRNLCAHYEDAEYVDSVHWYMLPLLEWLVTEWDFLFHEERLPCRPTADDGRASLQDVYRWGDEADRDHAYAWTGRHSLIAAREGGLFPDLVVRRFRDLLEFSWGPLHLPGTPPHYCFAHAEGRAYLRPEMVAAAVYGVIEDCVDFLTLRFPNSARIRGLQDKIKRLTDATRRETRIAMLAGLGHSVQEMRRRWDDITRILRSKSASIAASILDMRNEPLVVAGSCEGLLMFGSVSPLLGDADAAMLAEVLVDLYSPDGESPDLSAFVEEQPVHRITEPWREGYALAEEFLRRCPVQPQRDFVDVEGIVGALQVQVRDITLADQDTRAVAVAGPRHRAAILLNQTHQTNRYPSGRRFSLAHELCHLLYDRAHGKGIAVASGSWAPLSVEKRANAFAAMLLIPVSQVAAMERRDGFSWTNSHDIVRASKRLHVSFTSFVRHLHNIGRLDESSMDSLLEQCGQQTDNATDGEP